MDQIAIQPTNQTAYQPANDETKKQLTPTHQPSIGGLVYLLKNHTHTKKEKNNSICGQYKMKASLLILFWNSILLNDLFRCLQFFIC